MIKMKRGLNILYPFGEKEEKRVTNNASDPSAGASIVMSDVSKLNYSITGVGNHRGQAGWVYLVMLPICQCRVRRMQAKWPYVTIDTCKLAPPIATGIARSSDPVSHNV